MQKTVQFMILGAHSKQIWACMPWHPIPGIHFPLSNNREAFCVFLLLPNLFSLLAKHVGDMLHTAPIGRYHPLYAHSITINFHDWT